MLPRNVVLDDEELQYRKIVKKLSSLIRSVYSLSRIMPIFEMKKSNKYVANSNRLIMFDFKFYCNKKLNNTFSDANYHKRSLMLDIDIAKIFLSIKYHLKEEILELKEKIKNKKIEEKSIKNTNTVNKRFRVLSEDCNLYFMNKTNQFEILNYEDTNINDDYFQKKYATQLFSIKDTKEDHINSTKISDDFMKNPKSYFSNRRESYDIGKSHANNYNKHDYLSMISSSSSKEDKLSQIKEINELENKKKSLKCFETNLSKKIIESDSSSVSSLDSFELEFEDSEFKYNEFTEEKDVIVKPLISNDMFKLEDFILNMKTLKKQIKNSLLKINYNIIIKVGRSFN